ncbi:hypothetical protein IM511_04970 [Erythrobacteraceae bacterium E2-1 Yellow Sea]|nr:hypothetical protein [Erythrobacteraceae bacterium E2-1 Yellow Sea]
MMVSHSRLRQIGWAAVLAACIGLFLVLSFRVHAVKSEVLLAERQIIALQRETILLETEFEARASQRQLADWNAVDFGYEAPRADQYLENERQLASLGSPRAPGAPSPIRVAVAQVENSGDANDARMLSPLTGKPVTLAAAAQAEAEAGFAEAFGSLLADASPVRSAHARTMLSAEVSE